MPAATATQTSRRIPTAARSSSWSLISLKGRGFGPSPFFSLRPCPLGRRAKREGFNVAAPRFAEVTIRPDPPAPAAIEIELPGGIAVRVAGTSRVDDVVAILSRPPAR